MEKLKEYGERLRDFAEDYKSDIGAVLFFCFDYRRWTIFLERIGMLVALSFAGYIVWVSLISIFVAPFYSTTTSKILVEKEYPLEGETTVRAVEQGLQDILDRGLVTNFIGVRAWIDNRPNEQIGKLEIYRIAINTLENNLCRNRGTGGANKNLVQARSDIYADYELPYFTSYSTRLKGTINNINSYIDELKRDAGKPIDRREAVFVVNSDNLAEVLNKLKQQIQTNLAYKDLGWTEVDDRFYKIRGNLIATHQFLQGIDHDFKDKMIDKSSYEDNFVPVLQALERAIAHNPLVVTESFGSLSKLEKEANVISQKLGELRNKLTQG